MVTRAPNPGPNLVASFAKNIAALAWNPANPAVNLVENLGANPAANPASFEQVN